MIGVQIGERVVGYVTEELVEICYQNCVEDLRKKGNTAGLKALELERHGGKCHYCDVPFREVRVDNAFGKFSFFEPACKCYRKCVETELWDHPEMAAPGCGRWMVEERFRNLTQCLRCYGEPSEKKKAEKKSGRTKYKGKEAAAGDRDE